jgi:hypothetical protein
MAGTPDTTTVNDRSATTIDSEIPASVLRDAVTWAHERLRRRQDKPALPADIRERIIRRAWERLYAGRVTAENIAHLLFGYGCLEHLRARAIDRATLAAWLCDLEPRMRLVREAMRAEGQA